MSTRPETLDFLLDQLGDLPGLRTRRMFGEYCVYVDDKPVAFVCDDQLYVKPTPAGQALLPEPVWGKFYDKAQPHLLLTADRWDDRDLLRALLMATAEALPRPKPPGARRKAKALPDAPGAATGRRAAAGPEASAANKMPQAAKSKAAKVSAAKPPKTAPAGQAAPSTRPRKPAL